MRLSGVAEYAAEAFPVADDLDLQPWLLTWRDDKDPANTAAKEAKTLGDLRALLKATPD
jgi:hypothetical protein